MKRDWQTMADIAPGAGGVPRLGAACLVALVLVGVLGPWIAPYDSLEQVDSASAKHRPPLTVLPAVRLARGGWELADRVRRVPEGLEIERLGRTYVRPAAEIANLTAEGVADRRVFLLGSDRFGRDVLSRTLYGARVSLQIATFSIFLALGIGVAVGALAALGPKWLDAVLMRTVDALLAFPWLLLIIILAALYAPSPWTLIALLGCSTWMGISRLMRAELTSLREREFVMAARGLGASPWRVFRRHLLPNAMTPILVYAVLQTGNLILIESTLSFLGFGIPKPYATWGNMINESRPFMTQAWWEGGFPGLALVATVVALNLATDALRDRLDPRNQEC